jgi:hypothetical protein
MSDVWNDTNIDIGSRAVLIDSLRLGDDIEGD